MINSKGLSAGSLVLLGSEGVTSNCEGIWTRILGDGLRSLILLALPSETPSLVYLTRLDLAERGFSERGLQVHRTSLQELGQYPAGLTPDQSAVVFIAAERPQMLDDEEQGTAEHHLAALLELKRSGALIIAGATAAAGMGEMTLKPQKPFPKSPMNLEVAMSPGLGLLKRSIVLPYFEHLPASIINQVSQRADPGTWLIGIDENTALDIRSNGARCAGLGKVTLMRDNVVEWVGSDDEMLPADVFSPGNPR